MPGFPIVLSAPSGCGKTTLADRLVQADQGLKRSISFTTREPRAGEVNGRDYNFVSPDDFYEMIDKDDLLEWAEVYGKMYGQGRSQTEQVLKSGTDVLFILDPQGGQHFQDIFPEALLIYILPPSMTELEARLRQRQTDTAEVVAGRLRAAWDEIEEGMGRYPYLVKNSDLETCLADIQAIIRAHRIRNQDKDQIKQDLQGN